MSAIKKRTRRSKEELALEALKYTRKVDFQRRSNPHYKQAWRKGQEFLDKICSHMDIEWETKWISIEEVQEEAKKYSTRTDFARKSPGAYDRAQTKGWLDIVCGFMGEKPNRPYALGELRQIAATCENKEDFRKKNSGAFSAAHRMGVVDEICGHMKINWQIKWNDKEKISTEATKYKYRNDFKKHSAGAWDKARDLGILDEISTHMKLSKNVSYQETDLLNIVRNLYPKTQKLRDRKVKIADKPYIAGFDIDIYIPELRKGIEFDGTYWHSFEVMKPRKEKMGWSDDDIRNYHELKDSWFSSKGIQLLHIKEEDWNKNKQACIQKCLSFLGGENVEQTT